MEDNEDQYATEEQGLVLDSPETITTGLGAAELSNEDLDLLPSTYTGALTTKELAEKLRSADLGYAANKKVLQDQLKAARNVLLSQPTKQSKADWLLGVGSTLLAPGPVGRAGTLGESMSALGKYVSGQSERERLAEQQKQQQLAQFDLSATQAQVAQDEARRKGLQDLYYRMQNTEAANARAAALQESREKEGRENRANRLEAARIGAANPATRDAYGFGEIISTAANEAAAVLGNIQNLPLAVDTGIAGGRKTQSLFTAPIDALVNTTVNNQDVQRYNTQIAKLSYYIAQVQKGGRVVTRSDVDQLQEALTLRVGDKQLTRLTKMAEARQALERAFEVRIASPRTPEQLKDIYRQNLATIQQAVPFTVNDINKMASAKDKKKTFKQWYEEIGFGGKSSEKPTAAPGQKVMIGDREIYHKGGKWFFKDDNTEVKE